MIGCLMLAAGFVLVLSRATGGAPPAAPKAADSGWVKTEIYFGRNLPDGHEMSRGEWQDFMDKVLTKRFPKGLTVYEAYGQMQHEDGRIEKQSTWVVVLVHPGDPAAEGPVQEAVNAFRKQFAKAQVMLLNTPVSAKFFAD
jgi:hypothetical protein